MKPFCEVVVADVLPALRALIAKELMHLGLNQVQISKKLGVTQPAISQYMRELRGQRVKMLTSNGKVFDLIKVLSHDIATGDIDSSAIHMRFCQICRAVRDERLLCKLHQENYPMEACDICFKQS